MSGDWADMRELHRGFHLWNPYYLDINLRITRSIHLFRASYEIKDSMSHKSLRVYRRECERNKQQLINNEFNLQSTPLLLMVSSREGIDFWTWTIWFGCTITCWKTLVGAVLVTAVVDDITTLVDKGGSAFAGVTWFLWRWTCPEAERAIFGA